MMQTNMNNTEVALNETGWLKNCDDWNEEIAVEIAQSVNIELTDEHWNLIHIARDYYDNHHTCCPPRAFSRILKKNFGQENSGQKFIYQLFPSGGLVQCVNKIAGLPCPCDGSF